VTIRRGYASDGRGTLNGDGTLMAVATSQGTVIWDLDPDHLAAAACRVAGRDITRDEWSEHLASLGPYRTVCR
jgi:hypothetical protein